MKIDLHRKYRQPDYTIGILSIDGVRVCETIEDTDRGLTSDMSLEKIASIKIKGQTAIPVGTYPVTITFSPRFRKELPILGNVKGYEGVRIHAGNTAKDTEGCILPGRNTQKGMVTNSRQWTQHVINKIKSSKTPVIITIHW